MPDYEALRAGWIDGAHRQIGDTVTMTERQAAYLRQAGVIAPKAPPAPQRRPKPEAAKD